MHIRRLFQLLVWQEVAVTASRGVGTGLMLYKDNDETLDTRPVTEMDG
jgi:hypothetical protein